MKKIEMQALALRDMALELVQVAPTLDIDRLTIEHQPGDATQPNRLTIRKRQPSNERTVLDVLWRGDAEPLIVTYVGGSWEQILKRSNKDDADGTQ